MPVHVSPHGRRHLAGIAEWIRRNDNYRRTVTMPTSAIDSLIFRNIFGSAEMREVGAGA
jgi:hypothetical protein